MNRQFRAKIFDTFLIEGNQKNKLPVSIKSWKKSINFNQKLGAMKKIILRSLICIACFASVTSCSKNVKAPANKSAAAANTTNTTTTQTQTQDQDQHGHTCGGSSGSTSTYTGGSH